MPSLASVVKKFAVQPTLYWRKGGSDAYGKPTFTGPFSIMCRWEDKQKEIILSDNRKVLSKGYLLSPTPIDVGSLVFLGTLAQWKALPTYPAVPTVNQGVREVVLLNTTPDIKGNNVVYEAYL